MSTWCGRWAGRRLPCSCQQAISAQPHGAAIPAQPSLLPGLAYSLLAQLPGCPPPASSSTFSAQSQPGLLTAFQLSAGVVCGGAPV